MTGRRTWSGRAASSTEKAIFKITDGGALQAVKYLNENKNEITLLYPPVRISAINDSYIYVGFGYGMATIVESYLVRKTDGAVFQITKGWDPYDDSQMVRSYFRNLSQFKTDQNNNLYYITNAGNADSRPRVVKIDLNGINSLTCSLITPDTDMVERYDVDGQGNVIYDGNLVSSVSTSVSRIRKSNGGLESVSSTMYCRFIGLDKCLYGFFVENGTWSLKKLRSTIHIICKRIQL